jgi:uncharacterized membrane protein
MREILKDRKGAISITIIIALFIWTLLSVIFGYKLGDGQLFIIAIAAGVGLLSGLFILPNFAHFIRWIKGIYREIKK